MAKDSDAASFPAVVALPPRRERAPLAASPFPLRLDAAAMKRACCWVANGSPARSQRFGPATSSWCCRRALEAAAASDLCRSVGHSRNFPRSISKVVGPGLEQIAGSSACSTVSKVLLVPVAAADAAVELAAELAAEAVAPMSAAGVGQKVATPRCYQWCVLWNSPFVGGAPSTR